MFLIARPVPAIRLGLILSEHAGLNLAFPEDAKAVIKPWDEHDTSKFADSGVDDQVRFSTSEPFRTVG